MRTKYTARSFSSISVLLLLTVSGSLGDANAMGNSASSAAQSCSQLSARAEKAEAAITDRQATLTTVWQSQSDKVQILNSAHAKELDALRGKADIERSQNLEKLLSKATTDAERSAVQTYMSTVTNAVKTRRSAVDTAHLNYQTGITSLVQTRQVALAGQVEALRLAVSDAYATAANDCSDSANPAAIRASLTDSLAAARQNFASKRSADMQIGSEIRKLASTRQQTVQAANATFIQTTKLAQTALRAAFGSSADSL